jgi:hypothetical protein
MGPRYRSVAAAIALCAAAPLVARAADYVTLLQEVTVDRPADVVWPKISGFCQIGEWLGGSCVITTSGPEGVGTVRRLFDRVDEMMVAKTARSYTYVLRGPDVGLATGTVEARPDGPDRTRIIYTSFYEAEPTPAAKTEGQARRTGLFAKILAGMKAAAER